MLRLTQYHMNIEYKAGKYLDESLNLHVTSTESEEHDSFLSLAKVCETLMEDPVSVLLGDLILNG